MRLLFLLSLTLCVAHHANAAPAPKPDTKGKPPFPEAVMKAWQDAGARVGWWDGEGINHFVGKSPDEKTIPVITINHDVGNIEKLPLPENDFAVCLELMVIDPPLLKRLASWKSLKRIYLEQVICTTGTWECWKDLVQIEWIGYSGNRIVHENFPEDALKSWSSLPNLVGLQLNWVHLSTKQIDDLLKLENLIDFQFASRKFDANRLLGLSKLKRLRSLNLQLKIENTELLKEIIKLKDLESLDLELKAQKPKEISQLLSLQKLKRFYIEHEKIDSELVETLFKMEQLETLSISQRENESVNVGGFKFHKNLLELNIDSIGLSEQGVEQIAALPNLRKLGLRYINIPKNKFTDLVRLKKLEELELSSISSLDDEAVKGIDSLENLHNLRIHDQKLLSDTTLSKICKLRQLETLHLSETKMTCEEVPEITNLKLLKSLYLSQIPITDKGFSYFCQLPNLEILRVSNLISLKWEQSQKFEQLKNLKRLVLRSTPFNDLNLKEVAKISSLEILDLDSTKVTFENMLECVKLKNLRELDIDSRTLTNEGLRSLGKIPNLQKLVIRTIGEEKTINDEGFRHLTQLGSLISLKIEHGSLTLKNIDNISNFKNLKSIELEDCGIGDAGIKSISKISSLETIQIISTLDQDEPITNASLKELSRLPRIKGLRLSYSKITLEDVNELGQLSQLLGLTLDHGQVTDKGLKNIKGLKKLLAISLNNTPITDAGVAELDSLTNLFHIDLGSTKITDKSLLILGKLRNLTSITLSNTQVTAAGLETLAPLHLSWLSLQETKIPPEGFKRLQEIFPHTFIPR